jgi:4-amino-4-deoxy-L-arabinose transferase-like glycosyltransferase
MQLHQPGAAAFLMVPLFDICAFSVPFALGIYWRKKPEMHRRLLLVASCALTAAAFGRFPPNILPPVVFYAGVDSLIVLGLLRDLIVNRRIHQVYRYALPAFIVGQTVVMYTVVHNSPYWLKIANVLLR